MAKSHIDLDKYKVSPIDDGTEITSGMSSFEKFLKRTMDVGLSGLMLLVCSPIYLLIYLAVKKEDGGPAIYKQERIGLGGKPFNILKFRSMRIDAEKNGPQLFDTKGKDPRLTKVGAFLRDHHLDELPQIWNVFVGDMSFIGPRPERKFFIDKIMEADKRYRFLYQIRPGVTSLATLYNGYTDTLEKMLTRLYFDLYYVQNGSLAQDMKILWRTFYGILGGKKI